MTRRVLIVAAKASGGVVKQVIAHCHAMEHLGFDVSIAAPRDTLDLLTDLRPDVAKIPVPIGDRPSREDVKSIASLRSMLADVQIVHAHGARAGALVSLARRRSVVGSSGRSARPRLIVTLHNRPVGGLVLRGMGTGLIHLVAHYADVVLAVSPDLVAQVRRASWMRRVIGYVRGRTYLRTELAVVAAPGERPAPDLDVLAVKRRLDSARLILGWPLTDFALVTVARLAPQKGLETLIKAALVLRGDKTIGKQWRWYVAGDGPLRDELARQIRDAGLENHLILLGRCENVPVLLQAASIVVNTAVWEGQSVALMEALQVGSVIVATDVGGTRAVLGAAGRHVPASNPTALADMVAAIASSPSAQDRLRVAAVQRAESLSRVPELSEQLRNAYGDIAH